MRMRLLSLGFAAALASVTSACNYCGADEVRALTVSTVDSLAITRNGVTRRLQLNSRVAGREIEDARFEAVFNAIEDRPSSNRGILLTLSGTDPVTSELITMVMALPSNLDRGDVYTVNRTFVAEPGLSTDPGLWGERDLEGVNTADVAFTTSTYSFPPAQHTITYRAATATGTIRVTQRSRGYVEVDVAIGLADASGVAAALNGKIQINTERHTPPCIS
jgi:hypothetical protein